MKRAALAEAPDAAAEPKVDSGIPLSLYLHFPWCVRKCPYCDFNSHGLRGNKLENADEDAYVEALIRDLDFELRVPEPRPLVSIFMGGGTPSLFTDRAIGRVLEAMAARLAFAPDIEITLEANPGTVDAAHFRGYRAAGVNRLSIGVQSLDPEQLRRLGRIHDHADAERAVELARAAGFDNLNLDLMFALPQQSVAEAETDLRAALRLAPDHLSYYQLTLEPNTEFAARPPLLPDDESAWDMQRAGQALLADAGFRHYEVSAYARPGRRARHNLNYWQFGDYLGLGAGAHGKRSFVEPSLDLRLSIRRRARHKLPRTYLAAAGTVAAIQQDTEVAEAERGFEFAMNALRLDEGFRFVDFERRSGLPRQALDAPLRAARARGLLEDNERRDGVRASALGRSHLNALLREFL